MDIFWWRVMLGLGRIEPVLGKDVIIVASEGQVRREQ